MATLESNIVLEGSDGLLQKDLDKGGFGAGVVHKYMQVWLAMLARGEADFVFYDLADIKGMANNAEGTTVTELDPMKVKKTSLTEADPGDGQETSYKTYRIPCAEYGDYTSYTNRVSTWLDVKGTVPKIFFETARVGLASRDAIIEEALYNGGGKDFAQGETDVDDLTVDHVPTIADIIAITNNMKRQQIRGIKKGRFVAIVDSTHMSELAMNDDLTNIHQSNGQHNSFFNDNTVYRFGNTDFVEITYDRGDENANNINENINGISYAPIYILGQHGYAVIGGQIQSKIKDFGSFNARDIFDMTAAVGWYMPILGVSVIRPESVRVYLSAIEG